MENLDIKTVYIKKDFSIVDRTKEFYTFFESVGYSAKSIFELIDSHQKEKFINFVAKANGLNEFRVFKFKKISGEYIHQMLFVLRATDHCDNFDYQLRLISPESAIRFYEAAHTYEQKIRKILSITNEYTFTYHKASDTIHIYSYVQDNSIKVYDQDLDSWQEQMLADGLVSESSHADLKKGLAELRKCPETFEMKIQSTFRTGTSVVEKLVFFGERYEDLDGLSVIGRISSEDFIKQAKKSTSLIKELKLDPLTGTYNKKMILNYAEKRFMPGTKENAVLAIVDLDHFKPVNDAYGHLAGDKVLAAAGKVLKQIVGDVGIVGRYGGDEFLIILEDISDESTLRGILRTICYDIKDHFKDFFTDIKITASVGTAHYKKDGNSFDELFKKADFCLYRAKDKGRDRYVFFRQDLHGELYAKASKEKTEGIKYDVREVQELKSMADFLLNLSSAPASAVETVLEHMLKTYNLDSINIYYGEAMERMFTIGRAPDSLTEARYAFSNEFYTALDGNPYIRMDFATDLEEKAKPFGKILNDRGVKSSIQCLLGSPEHILGLVTFDRLREGALFAEYEKNCCIMFAAALNLLSETKLRSLLA